METDKFEQHIRTKLSEREITPSKEAWSKIACKLPEQTSSRKSGYFWMGIAASVLVVLGTVLFVLNTDINTPSKEIEVVAVPVKEAKEKGNEVNSINNRQDGDNAIVQHAVVEEETNVAATNEEFVAAVEEKETMGSAIDVAVLDDGPKEFRDAISPVIVSDAILDLKINEVIAQVDALELNSSVTEAEVDSLLQKAQQDILREKLFNPDYSVNAMALLTEVEEELDQSFRDQIFESLKTKFLKVRTAVADRNN